MSAATKVKLGDYLLTEGHISPSQLELAQEEKHRNHKFLGDTLVTLGFITEGILAQYLAKHSNTGFVNFSQIEVNHKAIEAIPYHMAKRYQVLPIDIGKSHITIAMADIYNVVAIDALEKACGLPVKALVATKSELLEALEFHYIRDNSLHETIQEIINQKQSFEDEESSPLIRLVDQIILIAIRARATDIHIEPEEKSVRIRMRIDGIMHEELLMPMQLKGALTARIKIMAGMDVTEKRVPQDGRIQFHTARGDTDLRVSSLPTQYGESIVIRVLDISSNKLSLENIGFSPKALKQFKKAIHTPHGIILITGPTGSGKTTTLYAAIQAIDSKQRSVFTLEDPIEYAMAGIRQVQVNDDIGMGFSQGLRALLRQDPDVILVGEIRDSETATLAMRAALTGHAVFSTLHTNDAISAIPRLMDMGIEPYLIPSSLTAIVAQRLVRKLCIHCKKQRSDTQEQLKSIGQPYHNGHTLWQAIGCSSCNESGYQGRLAIYEVLQVDDTFHQAIMNQSGPADILNIAQANGMQTMFEDGVYKALQGLTSLEEVMRVTK